MYVCFYHSKGHAKLQGCSSSTSSTCERSWSNTKKTFPIFSQHRFLCHLGNAMGNQLWIIFQDETDELNFFNGKIVINGISCGSNGQPCSVYSWPGSMCIWQIWYTHMHTHIWFGGKKRQTTKVCKSGEIVLWSTRINCAAQQKEESSKRKTKTFSRIHPQHRSPEITFRFHSVWIIQVFFLTIRIVFEREIQFLFYFYFQKKQKQIIVFSWLFHRLASKRDFFDLFVIVFFCVFNRFYSDIQVWQRETKTSNHKLLECSLFLGNNCDLRQIRVVFCIKLHTLRFRCACRCSFLLITPLCDVNCERNEQRKQKARKKEET